MWGCGVHSSTNLTKGSHSSPHGPMLLVHVRHLLMYCCYSPSVRKNVQQCMAMLRLERTSRCICTPSSGLAASQGQGHRGQHVLCCFPLVATCTMALTRHMRCNYDKGRRAQPVSRHTCRSCSSAVVHLHMHLWTYGRWPSLTVLWPHEASRLVGADGHTRQVKGAKPLANLLEHRAVPCVTCGMDAQCPTLQL